MIGDILSTNHLIRHRHVMIKEQGEDEASFLLFMIRKTIISFVLIIYDKKSNRKLPSCYL